MKQLGTPTESLNPIKPVMPLSYKLLRAVPLPDLSKPFILCSTEIGNGL